jgi:hypothetical protein
VREPQEVSVSDLEPTKHEEVSVQAIMKEIGDLELAMRELLLSADKAIAAAGTLIVSGLGLALTKSLLVVIIALPYALSAVFFFMLQKYIERAMRAGIRRRLEEVVNKRLQEEIYQQTRVVRSIKRPDEWAATGLYAGGAIAIVFLSFYSLAHYTAPPSLRWLSPHLWQLHIAGIIACLLLVATAQIRMQTAEGRAYKNTTAKTAHLTGKFLEAKLDEATSGYRRLLAKLGWRSNL